MRDEGVGVERSAGPGEAAAALARVAGARSRRVGGVDCEDVIVHPLRGCGGPGGGPGEGGRTGSFLCKGGVIV